MCIASIMRVFLLNYCTLMSISVIQAMEEVRACMENPFDDVLQELRGIVCLYVCVLYCFTPL